MNPLFLSFTTTMVIRMTNNIFTSTLFLFPIFTSVILLGGCSMETQFDTITADEFKRQPLQKDELLTESDLVHLPTPVQKYIRYTGAVGTVKIQNIRIIFDAHMFRKQGDAPMDASSVQYNFFRSPARIFFMKANRLYVPFRVLHTYRNQEASMVVRVASLFNAVDIGGEELTTAETVTILNDMCVFAPATLVDQRLEWKEIDSLSAEVRFTNGPFSVSAVLFFNTAGELINFVSDDRAALQDDGSLKRIRWSTPVRDYRDFNGRKAPAYGEAINHYPDRDFVYGTFTVKQIDYNVPDAQ